MIQSPSTASRTSLLNPIFVESLKLLGDRGLGVEFLADGNPDRSATHVLEEILECVSAVRKDQDPVKETKFVICEMGEQLIRPPPFFYIYISVILLSRYSYFAFLLGFDSTAY